jgi:hypothetical protein
MCNSLPSHLKVISHSCWIQSFRTWLLANTTHAHKFPTREFPSLILEWTANTVEAPSSFWMVGDFVRATSFSFIVDVADDLSTSDTIAYKKMWDSWVNQNADASVTANAAFHTAKAWVRAEAEMAGIDTTGYAILLVLLFNAVGILAFTHDPGLMLIAFAPVLSTLGGTCFFMFCIMGWKLGLIEGMALVVFIGHFVTHPLKIAHIYSVETGQEDNSQGLLCFVSEDKKETTKDCTACGGLGCGMCAGRREEPEEAPAFEEERRRRVRAAVLRVGGAMVSSAVTTLVTGIFLLCCTLRLFTTLGAVLIAASVLSVFFSLLVLPAALNLVGPGRVPFPVRCMRIINLLRGKGKTKTATADAEDSEGLVAGKVVP